MTNNLHLLGPCFHLLSQYINGLSAMNKSQVPQAIQSIREKFVHDASLLLHSLKLLYQTSHVKDKEWSSDVDVRLSCKILGSFYSGCKVKWGMNVRHFGNALYFEGSGKGNGEYSRQVGSIGVLSDNSGRESEFKKSEDTLQQKKSSVML